MILDSIVTKFKRPGSSSVKLSSDVLLPGWATNAGAVGASTDDVSTLSSLGRVVRTMGATADALPLGWSGPTEGFGHIGYYVGDGQYKYVDHQQDTSASG
jgi:hypothetical protein